MSEIGNSQLLSELKVMAAQARGDSAAINQEKDSGMFSGMLQDALDNVNAAQQQSGDLKKRFTTGDPTVSLIDTMVAGQKAGLAFDATLTIRNKLLEAYRSIMNMPI